MGQSCKHVNAIKEIKGMSFVTSFKVFPLNFPILTFLLSTYENTYTLCIFITLKSVRVLVKARKVKAALLT